MTKLSYEFRLDVTLEDASWACREAVAGMDSDPESVEPQRLVLRRRMLFGRDPAKVEILLSEAGPDAATVALNGQDPWGFGSRDRRNSLRNAVEVAARRSLKRR